MTDASKTQSDAVARLPQRAGVGLKPQHYHDILDGLPDIGWVEVHPENYMGAGGAPHHYLTRIREQYPISLHGVGLSIGAAGPLDRRHLARLKALVDRYEPESFSEHLAWSTHDDIFFNDLLPLPLNEETLQTVADHVSEVQDTLGRQMLIENPSTYVAFETSTMGETAFLSELSKRTGCGLLLDINNVFVQSTNHDFDPYGYVEGFPLDLVGEVHLGGHADDKDDTGQPLLIDSHDRAIVDPVWALYAHMIEKAGRLPTLIEWDNDIPDWPTLYAEAKRADALMSEKSPQKAGKAHARAA